MTNRRPKYDLDQDRTVSRSQSPWYCKDDFADFIELRCWRTLILSTSAVSSFHSDHCPAVHAVVVVRVKSYLVDSLQGTKSIGRRSFQRESEVEIIMNVITN